MSTHRSYEEQVVSVAKDVALDLGIDPALVGDADL